MLRSHPVQSHMLERIYKKAILPITISLLISFLPTSTILRLHVNNFKVILKYVIVASNQAARISFAHRSPDAKIIIPVCPHQNVGDLFLSMCESKTIWWDDGLWLIDQTRLPGELLPLRIKSVRQLIEAIKTLRVRGAPALGAAGGYGIALAARLSPASNAPELMDELDSAADMIKGSRPTAINLSWGVDRAMRAAALQETAEDIRDGSAS